MTRTHIAPQPSGIRIDYVDHKRMWWALSLVFPLMPMLGLAAHAWSGAEIALLLPFLISYGFIPLLDYFVGEDENNPPEEVVSALEQERYYRWLTWAIVPLHFVALIGCAWWVGSKDLSWWAVLIVAFVAGTNSGLGLNTGHELGHKYTRTEQWLARWVLAVPVYGHFTVEHGQGHHRWVATPEDHASSRMGESIYRFAWRELPGGVRRAWRIEKKRLNQSGRATWSGYNTMLQSYALAGVLQLSLILTWGWVMVPFLAVHNVVAWWQLTSANYVEHYGLLREQLPNGQYETPKPHHSWNANHVVSNLAMFHLQRHSDHHANPSRRYQSLRHFENLPQLPSGYFGMFPLAYIPALWFKVMNPRLLALPHIQGDMNKINIDPTRKSQLLRRYGAFKPNPLGSRSPD